MIIMVTSPLVGRKWQGGERALSSYTYGPLGVVTRTAEAATATTSDNCTFGYLSDATGHCLGVVPLTAGTPSIEWTRMDAWGNLLTALPAATQPCGSQPAVNTGPYQYHGHDGYETDLVDPQRGVRDPDENLGRQTVPDPGRSTQFIHIGVRYYEPGTGRFLQRDDLPIDPLPLTYGQNNRWTYAGNDPVNSRDLWGLETATTTLSAMGGRSVLAAIVFAGIGATIGGVIVTGCLSLAHRPFDLPVRGRPNTSESSDDGGGRGQIRDYGPDGRARKDIDFGHDHGHGDPHTHDWDWSKTRAASARSSSRAGRLTYQELQAGLRVMQARRLCRMVLSKGLDGVQMLQCGWIQDVDITKVLQCRDITSSLGARFVTITCIDSNRSVVEVLAHLRRNRFVPSSYSNAPMATMTIDSFVTWISKTNDILVGFDEIWLGNSLPTTTPAEELCLTSEIPITDRDTIERIKSCAADWMNSNGMVLGLGDGYGLNYFTYDAAIPDHLARLRDSTRT